jgi:hypothetical protein
MFGRLADVASRPMWPLAALASCRCPMRGLLYSDNYRPLFSGHETFALWQLWLKKAVDVVGGDQNRGRQNGHGHDPSRSRTKNIFSDDASIVTLGVGKNMVGSIRHWATACDVLTQIDGNPTHRAPLRLAKVSRTVHCRGRDRRRQRHEHRTSWSSAVREIGHHSETLDNVAQRPGFAELSRRLS